MLKKTRSILTLAVAALSLQVFPALAAQLTTSDKNDVARVEGYLNQITTLKARFLQVNSAGQIAQGDVYMRRPGRMRFEYEPPAQLLVVADGTWLVLHDKELEETNRLPLSATPVSVLLQEDAKLSGDVTVLSVEKDGGTLRINIIDTDEPDEGGITLVFDNKPLKLRKWLVTDAQGNTTSVTLSDMERGLKIKPELFTFFDSEYE